MELNFSVTVVDMVLLRFLQSSVVMQSSLSFFAHLGSSALII